MARTSREVRVARWKSRSSPLDEVPSARAAVRARWTWPEISSSPTTSDSSPELTANRWWATPWPEWMRAVCRNTCASEPMRSARVANTASVPTSTAAVSGSSISRYASNRLQVASTTAPRTNSAPPTRSTAVDATPRLTRSSRSKSVVRWSAVTHSSTAPA